MERPKPKYPNVGSLFRDRYPNLGYYNEAVQSGQHPQEVEAAGKEYARLNAKYLRALRKYNKEHAESPKQVNANQARSVSIEEECTKPPRTKAKQRQPPSPSPEPPQEELVPIPVSAQECIDRACKERPSQQQTPTHCFDADEKTSLMTWEDLPESNEAKFKIQSMTSVIELCERRQSELKHQVDKFTTQVTATRECLEHLKTEVLNIARRLDSNKRQRKEG